MYVNDCVDIKSRINSLYFLSQKSKTDLVYLYCVTSSLNHSPFQCFFTTMSLNKTDDITIQPSKTFPLVAIGGGAGGTDALSELYRNLDPTTGMTYFYILHPEARYEEDLKDTLSALNSIPIILAEAGTAIQQNHLYLIPFNKEMTLVDGEFRKKKTRSSASEEMPITLFFRGLAERYGEQVIGILLSGTASDGIIGLKAIKATGGLTFAQDGTAQFRSMSRSAIAEGAVDLVLPPHEMAEELARIGQQKDSYEIAVNQTNEELIGDRDEHLLSILHLLNRATQVDFTQYKMNTIKRRIIRRMMVYKLNKLQDYLAYIKQHSNEVQLLYQDLLINVTTFFRDPETTNYLKKELLPKLFQTKGAADPVRIWVPACSTGQEAYSMAMLLMEVLGENTKNILVQIFATDLSETAINKARLGVYTKDDVLEMSPERLQRFFTKLDGGYRIIKSLRDLCVFANHNISKDPPFSRLDIISCCNLLIYLDTPLQQKLISTFHYSLNPTGSLILGKSETTGSSSYLFSQVDKKVKVYAKRKDATAKVSFETAYRTHDAKGTAIPTYTHAGKIKPDEADLEKAVDSLLLKRFTPASVLVNYDLDILHFRGATGLYLEPSPGKASLNLMKMARSGLSFELRNVVHKAKKTGAPAKKSGIQISIEDRAQLITVEAIPVKADADDEYFLVVFAEMELPKKDIESESIADERVKQLESELVALREDMRSIVEAQEAANEELQSANEEIVSSNEELQSINEELETSKEEIESSNEELITINQELQVRNDQLAEAQDYSDAIFTTLRESLLILDNELRITSANSTFFKTYRIREEETIGQHLFDLQNRQWNTPRLRELLDEILPNSGRCFGFEMSIVFDGIGEKTLLINARRVQQKGQAKFKVLLAIEDVTEFKQAQQIITERESWFRNMADNAPVMIWVTGANRLCTFVNKLFLDFRGIRLEEAIGNSWALDAHPDDLELCEKVYNTCFDEKRGFELNYRLKHRDGSYRQVFTKAKPNFTTEGHFTGFIGSCVELGENKIL